jgi:urease subunit gamma/beta
MHLSPQEIDKLTLHAAGSLAQQRLARGVKLNHPEAVALIATVLLELIRDGRSVSQLMSDGRLLLGRRQVMAGVPEMIDEVQVEGTFPDGSKLVTVHHPVAREDGDLTLALYGSFLPVPALETFGPLDPMTAAPGAYGVSDGTIALNAGRSTVQLAVTNTGDRPVQVGSHYPFVEVNRALVFDRAAALGMRLDVPAGTAVRFEPGEKKTVQLVAIAGHRVIRGGNALVDGPADDPKAVLARVQQRGFGHAP